MAITNDTNSLELFPTLTQFMSTWKAMSDQTKENFLVSAKHFRRNKKGNVRLFMDTDTGELVGRSTPAITVLGAEFNPDRCDLAQLEEIVDSRISELGKTLLNKRGYGPTTDLLTKGYVTLRDIKPLYPEPGALENVVRLSRANKSFKTPSLLRLFKDYGQTVMACVSDHSLLNESIEYPSLGKFILQILAEQGDLHLVLAEAQAPNPEDLHGITRYATFLTKSLMFERRTAKSVHSDSRFALATGLSLYLLKYGFIDQAMQLATPLIVINKTWLNYHDRVMLARLASALCMKATVRIGNLCDQSRDGESMHSILKGLDTIYPLERYSITVHICDRDPFSAQSQLALKTPNARCLMTHDAYKELSMRAKGSPFIARVLEHASVSDYSLNKSNTPYLELI